MMAKGSGGSVGAWAKAMALGAGFACVVGACSGAGGGKGKGSSAANPAGTAASSFRFVPFMIALDASVGLVAKGDAAGAWHFIGDKGETWRFAQDKEDVTAGGSMVFRSGNPKVWNVDGGIWILGAASVARSLDGTAETDFEGKVTEVPLPGPAAEAGASLRAVGVAKDHLYVSAGSLLWHFAFADGQISIQEITLPKDAGEGPLAAGPTEDGLWLWRGDRLFRLDAQRNWRPQPFRLDLEAKDKLTSLAMDAAVKDGALRVNGLLMAVAGGQAYVAAAAGAAVPPGARLSFADHVKPLADKYCTPCHEGGTRLITEDEWRAHADAILQTIDPARKAEADAMPPPGGSEAKAISDDDRALMARFLKQGRGPTGGGVDGGGGGPTNTLIAGELKDIAGPYCLSCHQHATQAQSLDWWRNGKSGILSQLQSRTMPKVGSQQATDFPADKRQKLIELIQAL